MVWFLGKKKKASPVAEPLYILFQRVRCLIPPRRPGTRIVFAPREAKPNWDKVSYCSKGELSLETECSW